MSTSPIDFSALRQHVISNFALQTGTVHGPDHWHRVEQNGLQIAAWNNANTDLIQLFAVLHDSKRENENYDPGHGPRGAIFTRELNGHFFDLDENDLQTLCFAIEHHADGGLSEDPTIGACWDADRLDLGRVGMVPRAQYFSTNAAKMLLKMRRQPK